MRELGELIDRGLAGSNAYAPSTNVAALGAFKFIVSPLNFLALLAVYFYVHACHISHTIPYMLTNFLHEG